MRVRLRHEIAFHYEPATRAILKVLRLEPRNHEAQQVSNWRLSADIDCRMKPGEDAFGNFTHTFAVQHPTSSVMLEVECEIVTIDTAGVVRAAAERFPPELFLRETALTEASPKLRHFAAEATTGGSATLDRLHGLRSAVAKTFDWDRVTPDKAKPAAEVFGAGHGNAAELAHLFVAGARCLDIPARFIAGYDLSARDRPDLSHCWAEAFVEGLGWVGFDPAHGNCPTDGHVRLACGLDHLGAVAIRSTPSGPSVEQTTVKMVADELRLSS